MKLVVNLIGIILVCSALAVSTTTHAASENLRDGDIEIENFDKRVNKYSPVTIEVRVNAIFQDPYDYEDVKIDAIVTTPLGDTTTYPSYFEENSNGSSIWKIRMTPRQTGNYSFRVTIESEEINTSTGKRSFRVSGSDENGFLQVSNNSSNYYLRFDSGRPFRGIGQNFGWEARNLEGKDTVYTYSSYLQKLSNEGVNFIRTWMCPWNLPLEWKNPDNPRYKEEEKYRFNRSAIGKIDSLISIAEKNDIYLMVALDYHGALLTEPDYWGGNNYWPQNPYNKANGGFAEEPAGFFTNPEARKRYKKRLRFIIARWGYSPHLAVLEFWNEIDNAMADQNITPDAIVNWHEEMAEYLAQIDPYNHIMTTSTSHRPIPGLYKIPELDFAQAHLYGQTDRMDFLMDSLKAQTGKPVVVGEIAYDWKSPKPEKLDLFREDLHRSLWEGLFSETPILPMTWWWEFFYENGANSEFASVARFEDLITTEGANHMERVEFETPRNVETRGLKNSEAIFAWLRQTGKMGQENEIIIRNVKPGKYQIEWYDTREGRFYESSHLTVTGNSGLILPLNRLKENKDVALMIEKQ